MMIGVDAFEKQLYDWINVVWFPGAEGQETVRMVLGTGRRSRLWAGWRSVGLLTLVVLKWRKTGHLSW
jgi:hypothetical protein